MSADIRFNAKLDRWEVYGENPVIRAGDPQPEFASPSMEKCEAYKAATERGRTE